jgi:DNA-binding NtrC family response regulator
MSKRRNEGYIEVNCAAIPKDLLESELFGHEKGAFTGADSQKIGKIESANNGTLLLDELGKMPEDLQAKLLKVVEDDKVCRVGSVKPVKINVRFLATLQPGEIERINKDLLYRFSWPIHIKMPSLKERLEVLGNTIINNSLGRVLKKIKLKDVSLSPGAYRKLINREDYPGNYRELENTILDAVLSAEIEERKEVLPKDISFGNTFNNEALRHVDNIKLKDIVAYADKEGSTLRANIIQKKIDKIEDIKNTLKSEGLSDNEYRNYEKKIRNRLKK